MIQRSILAVLCLAMLTGFQPSELRWRSPATLTLRFMAAGMPAGMYLAAQVAASMWQSERVKIRIVNEQLRRWVYDNGVVVQGVRNRREAEIALWIQDQSA